MCQVRDTLWAGGEYCLMEQTCGTLQQNDHLSHPLREVWNSSSTQKCGLVRFLFGLQEGSQTNWGVFFDRSVYGPLVMTLKFGMVRYSWVSTLVPGTSV